MTATANRNSHHLAGVWSFLARVLAAIESPSKVSAAVQTWHRVYGYQPAKGITTATITHASLYGSMLQLDVLFPHVSSMPSGVFELPASAVRHLHRDLRFKFCDPAELYGVRIHLHTGPQFQHDGYPRSHVIGVKVLSIQQQDSMY